MELEDRSTYVLDGLEEQSVEDGELWLTVTLPTGEEVRAQLFFRPELDLPLLNEGVEECLPASHLEPRSGPPQQQDLGGQVLVTVSSPSGERWQGALERAGDALVLPAWEESEAWGDDGTSLVVEARLIERQLLPPGTFESVVVRLVRSAEVSVEVGSSGSASPLAVSAQLRRQGH